MSETITTKELENILDTIESGIKRVVGIKDHRPYSKVSIIEEIRKKYVTGYEVQKYDAQR